MGIKGIALPVLATVGLAMTLGGCGDFRRALGYDKSIPDEFAVVSRAPLAIPPDYSLRPPQPGAAPTQDVPTQDRAKEAVFRAGTQQASLPPAATQRSAGEGAFLAAAGAPKADPNIRARVSDDTALTPENQRGFVDKLLFWRKSGAPDNVIDPVKEADRIKQAQAAGTPVAPDVPGASAQSATQQQPAPTIERKKSTSIFNMF